jgi:5-methyltetrahydropteroyltriglutamate--homocysteine methyltransferase
LSVKGSLLPSTRSFYRLLAAALREDVLCIRDKLAREEDMSASTNRIATTHVGSLVRPPEFVKVLKQREQKPNLAGFDAALAKAVEDVVRRQAEAGIDIVSDGEFGKGIGWEQYVLERVSGFKPADAPLAAESGAVSFGDMARFADFYREYFPSQNLQERPFDCVGPIQYTGHAALKRDISNLKSAIAKVRDRKIEGFLPVSAPASALALSTNRYYKTEQEYIYAMAEAQRTEYKTIVDAGLIAQIDDAHLPFTYDRMVPPATLQDFKKWAQLRIDAVNHAIRGLPQERLRYHICWGSWNGPHMSDVPLKDIVDLLVQINVGGYCIEAANPRHEHEWVVWKQAKLPDGKKLLPGVISHATNVVEHPELVAQRLVRFADVVGRDNVIGSTDCGFAQGPYVQRVHPSIMWAKLEALAEGARLASQELWGRRAA